MPQDNTDWTFTFTNQLFFFLKSYRALGRHNFLFCLLNFWWNPYLTLKKRSFGILTSWKVLFLPLPREWVQGHICYPCMKMEAVASAPGSIILPHLPDSFHLSCELPVLSSLWHLMFLSIDSSYIFKSFHYVCTRHFHIFNILKL